MGERNTGRLPPDRGTGVVPIVQMRKLRAVEAKERPHRRRAASEFEPRQPGFRAPFPDRDSRLTLFPSLACRPDDRPCALITSPQVPTSLIRTLFHARWPCPISGQARELPHCSGQAFPTGTESAPSPAGAAEKLGSSQPQGNPPPGAGSWGG